MRTGGYHLGKAKYRSGNLVDFREDDYTGELRVWVRRKSVILSLSALPVCFFALNSSSGEAR